MLNEVLIEKGYFDGFGGCYAPEVMKGTLDKLNRCYRELKENPIFVSERQKYLQQFACRPTSLTLAAQLTDYVGGAQIYLKREDLARTGSWCINNALGQGLLAKYMGKTRLVTGTGSGSHGVATAAVARLLDLDCTIYMGARDIQRETFSAHNIEQLGATLIPDYARVGKLREALSEAVRDWVANVKTTHNVIPSVVGPHPYPMIVRDFQSVIGREVADQLSDKTKHGSLHLAAPVGGGGCALGLFYPFLGSDQVTLIAVEAAGPKSAPELNAAKLAQGTTGVYMGSKTRLLQDRHGQIKEPHSIAADLNLPVVGPELACLYQKGLISSALVTDEEALSASELAAEIEHLYISLESAHVLAHAVRLAAELPLEDSIVVPISGQSEGKGVLPNGVA